MNNSSEVRVQVDIIFPFLTFSPKAEESVCYFPRKRSLGLPGGVIICNGGQQKRKTVCLSAEGEYFQYVLCP